MGCICLLSCGRINPRKPLLLFDLVPASHTLIISVLLAPRAELWHFRTPPAALNEDADKSLLALLPGFEGA